MAYPSFNSGDVLNASDMNAVGTWKLATGTFSAQTAVNIDSVFTADYDVYRLCWYSTQTDTAHELRLLFRTAGSTNTNNNYLHQNTYFTTAAFAVRNNVATSYSMVTQNVGADNWQWEMLIYNPFSSTRNTIFAINGAATGTLSFCGSGAFNTTTSFDGVRIITSAGTFTGEYWMYGMRQ